MLDWTSAVLPRELELFACQCDHEGRWAGEQGTMVPDSKQKSKRPKEAFLCVKNCVFVRPHPTPGPDELSQPFVIHLQIEIHLNDMAPRRGRKLPTKQLPWKLHWVSVRYFLLFENINMVIHFSYQTFSQITVSNTENTSQMEMYSKKAYLFSSLHPYQPLSLHFLSGCFISLSYTWVSNAVFTPWFCTQ